MSFVVVWRNPSSGARCRSHVFSGPGAAGDAHAYAIGKAPPAGFVFQSISAVREVAEYQEHTEA